MAHLAGAQRLIGGEGGGGMDKVVILQGFGGSVTVVGMYVEHESGLEVSSKGW